MEGKNVYYVTLYYIFHTYRHLHQTKSPVIGFPVLVFVSLIINLFDAFWGNVRTIRLYLHHYSNPFTSIYIDCVYLYLFVCISVDLCPLMSIYASCLFTLHLWFSRLLFTIGGLLLFASWTKWEISSSGENRMLYLYIVLIKNRFKAIYSSILPLHSRSV